MGQIVLTINYKGTLDKYLLLINKKEWDNETNICHR